MAISGGIARQQGTYLLQGAVNLDWGSTVGSNTGATGAAVKDEKYPDMLPIDYEELIGQQVLIDNELHKLYMNKGSLRRASKDGTWAKLTAMKTANWENINTAVSAKPILYEWAKDQDPNTYLLDENFKAYSTVGQEFAQAHVRSRAIKRPDGSIYTQPYMPPKIYNSLYAEEAWNKLVNMQAYNKTVRTLYGKIVTKSSGGFTDSDDVYNLLAQQDETTKSNLDQLNANAELFLAKLRTDKELRGSVKLNMYGDYEQGRTIDKNYYNGYIFNKEKEDYILKSSNLEKNPGRIFVFLDKEKKFGSEAKVISITSEDLLKKTEEERNYVANNLTELSMNDDQESEFAYHRYFVNKLISGDLQVEYEAPIKYSSIGRSQAYGTEKKYQETPWSRSVLNELNQKESALYADGTTVSLQGVNYGNEQIFLPVGGNAHQARMDYMTFKNYIFNNYGLDVNKPADKAKIDQYILYNIDPRTGKTFVDKDGNQINDPIRMTYYRKLLQSVGTDNKGPKYNINNVNFIGKYSQDYIDKELIRMNNDPEYAQKVFNNYRAYYSPIASYDPESTVALFGEENVVRYGTQIEIEPMNPLFFSELLLGTDITLTKSPIIAPGGVVQNPETRIKRNKEGFAIVVNMASQNVYHHLDDITGMAKAKYASGQVAVTEDVLDQIELNVYNPKTKSYVRGTIPEIESKGILTRNEIKNLLHIQKTDINGLKTRLSYEDEKRERPNATASAGISKILQYRGRRDVYLLNLTFDITDYLQLGDYVPHGDKVKVDPMSGQRAQQDNINIYNASLVK